TQSHHREHNQRGNLNDIDRNVDRGRTVYTAIGDISHAKRRDDGAQSHEDRARIARAHESRLECSGNVAAENTDYGHHHARIDPVVQVGTPTDNKLGKPGITPRLIVVEKRLFREIIRAAGTRI